MKKFTILFLSLLMGVTSFVQAQTQVQLSDVNANYFTAINPATKLPDTTKVAVRISCNIQNIEQAKQLHVLLGTVAGLGDGLTTTATVAKQNEMYVLNCNNTAFPVHGYKAHVQLLIDKSQWTNCKYLTLYIEDNNGNNTTALVKSL